MRIYASCCDHGVSMFFGQLWSFNEHRIQKQNVRALAGKGLTAGSLDKLRDVSAMDKILLLSEDQVALAHSIQEPLKYVFLAMAVPLALVNIIVFSMKSMRSASGTYVIALNAGQLSYVLLNTIDGVWDKSTQQPFSERSYCAFKLFATVYLGIYVAKRGSYVILCLATVERLYAVVRPMHVKNFVLAKRPLICVIAVYAFVAIVHMPNVIIRQVTMRAFPSIGELCTFVFIDVYYRHEELFKAFEVVQKIVLTIATLGIQVLLNVLIALSLRRHNLATKHVTSSANEDTKRRQERQLTITLLGIAISHVTFAFPADLFNVFAIVFSEFTIIGKYAKLYSVILDFVYNMTVMGCGVDFFCYLALSSNFRKTICRLFRCKVKNENLAVTQNQTLHDELSISETRKW